MPSYSYTPPKMVLPWRVDQSVPLRWSASHAGRTAHDQNSIYGSARQYLCLERVVPTIEVNIAPAPFDLATLEVDGLGTEMLLVRNQRLAVIVIEDDAVRIESA